jgi:2-oxoisovalerate dehydrogenase E1 component alpha subunit
LRGEDKVVLTSIGEGSTSQGEWYEGINWAAIHKLPVIFLVENNVYAISVRQDQQMAVKQVADKAKGLGLPGESVDGLDAVKVYEVVSTAVERARSGQGPTLIELRVSRMTPHSSDDDDRSYRPREEVEAMKALDPVPAFADFLLKEKTLRQTDLDKLEAEIKNQVEDAVQHAEAAPYPDVAEASSLVNPRRRYWVWARYRNESSPSRCPIRQAAAWMPSRYAPWCI